MRAVYVLTPLIGFVACSPFSSDPSATGETPEAGAGTRKPDASSSGPADGGTLSKGDAYAKAVIDDGPLAYWRCRDGAPGKVKSEVGAHALDATLGAGGPKQVAGGLFEGGGECDFAGEFSSYGTASLRYLGNADYTLEVWFKPAATPDKDNFRHLFEQTNGNTGNAFGIYLHRFDGQGLDALGVEEFEPTPQVHRFINVPMPPKDSWHHIVMTKGPKLFVDGQPQGSLETNTDYVEYVRPFLWGSKSVDSDRSIVGAVTEIAVYQQSLTAERILVHYSLGKP